MFIIELTTRQGHVRERFETYAEAQRRIEQFPADSLIGVPLIFEELADASERLVREDGKPLQFHREIVEEPVDEEPLQLAEDEGNLMDADGKFRLKERAPVLDDWEDLPLISPEEP